MNDNVTAFPQLTFYRGSLSDIDAASALVHDVWHATYSHYLPAQLIAERTREETHRLLQGHIARCWIARQDDRVVGVCAASTNCIEDLWVDTNFQRRGIGRHLLVLALDDMAAHDYQNAQVGCEDFNYTACRFFTGLGWKLIGREPMRTSTGHEFAALVYTLPVHARSLRHSR